MSDDCRLMNVYGTPNWDKKAEKCDGECEICNCYKKERIRDYKCKICGIRHKRGKLFNEHFKYRAGHKQKHRGAYKKTIEKREERLPDATGREKRAK